MASTAKLQFLTTGGQKVYINVSNPVPAVSSEELEDIMDSIIQKNIFITKSGELTAKVKAEVVTTTSTVYNYDLNGSDD